MRCNHTLSRKTDFRRWCLKPLAALCLLGLLPDPVRARDYFDPSFLNNGGEDALADLSAYETAGGIPEGTYLVDIYLNQTNVASRSVQFYRDTAGKVIPALTPKELQEMGVGVSRIDALKSLPPTARVGELTALIPQARVEFDLSQLRLNISVPQASMDNPVGGYVDPALWDEGIPAALFNYTLSGSQSRNEGISGSSGSTLQSLFGSVNGGLNAGPWRLRSTMTYTGITSRSNGASLRTQQTHWNNTSLRRDVQALRGALMLGETSTGNTVFDGIPFRGAKLVSDNDMLPSSQRGFAPVLTGIASSNARVSVSQNGYVIYQTNVAPGPFRIADISRATGGGDLVMTVTEADGSEHVTTQAYSTLPIMQRPGGMEYEVSVGRYQNGGYTAGAGTPSFLLGTLIYGLPHYVTLYGGVLASGEYQSVAFGTGVSLGDMGALSADVTGAKVTLPGQRDSVSGAAYRARYSKSMLSTGTSLDLTTYRYATRDFYTFSEANSTGYLLRDNVAPWQGERRRSSWQTSISQNLGNRGSLYLRGNRDDYWGSTRVVNSLSAGFGSSIKGVGYNLAYSEDHTRSPEGGWPTNRQVSLSVSVPLSLFSNAESVRNMSANYMVSHDSSGRTSQQSGISGNALDNTVSWSASGSRDNQGSGTSGNLGLGYMGDAASVNLGYGYTPTSRTVNASAMGGMVAHRHGVVFSQYLGDTVALVSAPGVEGVRVASGNARTNGQGYAVSPYMQNYQRNVVSLDPTTLPDGADITTNSVNVYPTRGAVVEAKFRTRIGRQAMLSLSYRGKPVPFGATATATGTDGEQNSSIVGDDGMVYLSGLPSRGGLRVQWGKGAAQQCRVDYDLGEAPESASRAINIVQQQRVCR
ncbi:fimbria/pilus outer membrane usher protein [Enterobacter cloacae]|uniref:fimbria/pilus outer membrane usher protein n=1 Tax=Enterobacter cloacae TaxID=550 RepID=UPI002B1F3415|nr:fimbria/pilus outer membrane usher protein [Enterobacter cloacae]MEA5217576.1 fimbria/pilus outer membrane usher protein [Enterobacter cloacae]